MITDDKENGQIAGHELDGDYLFLFCQEIIGSSRILPSHVSLFVAIYHTWLKNGRKQPFTVNRRDLMLAARINSISTYHKCIKDLIDLNFIAYDPTYNYHRGSQISLL